MDVSTDQILARVKSRYEIAGDEERSALEGILAIVPVIISQSAEIDRLKAELELRTKERDQAIAYLEKVEQEHGILIGLWLFRNPDKYPDLSRHVAHLAGRGE